MKRYWRRRNSVFLLLLLPIVSLTVFISMSDQLSTPSDDISESSHLEAVVENNKRLKEENALLKEEITLLRSSPDQVYKNLQLVPTYSKVQAEMVRGVPLGTEYDLVPFTRFTATRLYLAERGLGGRMVEKPIGHKRKDIAEILDFALAEVNKGRGRGRHLSRDDFVEGMYRQIPGVGAQYEILLQDPSTSGGYRRVNIARAYVGPTLLENEAAANASTTIHVVIPLLRRTDSLDLFLENFQRVTMDSDGDVTLTIASFGTLDEVATVRDRLQRLESQWGFKAWHVIPVAGNFSRSRGLQAGIEVVRKLHQAGPNPLLFLCDIDVVFSPSFLRRCRSHPSPGRRVYYPIVFSLYNPHIVYRLHDLSVPKSIFRRLIVSKETGFWRDFGYGMTCQYLSDYDSVLGFDGVAPKSGWGLEDVELYRKYVKSSVLVVRATDQDIFHIWHPKECSPLLPADQYRGCIRSKALNEASHAQLGLLAFKDEVDLHRSYKRKDH